MTFQSWLIALAAVVTLAGSAHAFTLVPTSHAPRTCNNRPTRAASSQRLSMAKTTLTEQTTWRLRLLLNDLTTTQGKKLDGQLFVIEGNFIEEEGYEPPQGTFKPTKDTQDGGEGMSLETTNSYWKLSEDPNDPKVRANNFISTSCDCTIIFPTNIHFISLLGWIVGLGSI